MSEIPEDQEGIFDGCFFVWVDVTKKYMSGKEKQFNDYRKIQDESDSAKKK